MGAYISMIEQWNHKVKTCAGVELHDDGTYKITHYKPSRCRALFMAAYSLYGWMVENKINEKEQSDGN